MWSGTRPSPSGGGICDTADANAEAADLASGASAYVNGVKIEGTHECESLSEMTADATATEADLLSGKTAYVGGEKIEGQIPTVAMASPAVTVDGTGLVTASVTQSAGYCEGGTKTTTQQLSTKAAQTYTPGTSAQTIASGQYLTGAQTISGDADLVAGNIKSGVNIFGVAGSFTSDATATAANIEIGKTAYVNGSKVTGTLVVPNPVSGSFTGDGTCSVTLSDFIGKTYIAIFIDAYSYNTYALEAALYNNGDMTLINKYTSVFWKNASGYSFNSTTGTLSFDSGATNQGQFVYGSTYHYIAY